jgi:hypothetical protein
LIEKTGKFWKFQMLLSSIAAILGVMMSCAGNQTPGGQSFGAIGTLLLIGGIFWFVVARIGAWWEHG